MMRSALAVAALLALPACAASFPGGRGGGQDDFSRNTLPEYIGSTDDAPSRWRIERGKLVGKGRAIQSVLVRGDFVMADGWVEAEASHADDGGLVLRYRNPEAYYLLTFRDDGAPSPRGEMNLAAYHRIDGQYREIWRHDVSWPRGMRRTVRFEAWGPLLRVYLDGEPVGEFTPRPAINDPAPYVGPGYVGVRHYGADDTWRVEFDRFRWRRTR